MGDERYTDYYRHFTIKAHRHPRHEFGGYVAQAETWSTSYGCNILLLGWRASADSAQEAIRLVKKGIARYFNTGSFFEDDDDD